MESKKTFQRETFQRDTRLQILAYGTFTVWSSLFLKMQAFVTALLSPCLWQKIDAWVQDHVSKLRIALIRCLDYEFDSYMLSRYGPIWLTSNFTAVWFCFQKSGLHHRALQRGDSKSYDVYRVCESASRVSISWEMMVIDRKISSKPMQYGQHHFVTHDFFSKFSHSRTADEMQHISRLASSFGLNFKCMG